MRRVARRLLASLVLQLPATAAQALDERAAVRALLGAADEPACSLAAPWGPPAEGVFVVAAFDDSQAIRVALMRDGAGDVPEIVASPAGLDPIAIDPPWACVLEAVPPPALGGRRVIALRVSNSYTSTGRSSSTEALHLLLVEGAALPPFLAA